MQVKLKKNKRARSDVEKQALGWKSISEVRIDVLRAALNADCDDKHNEQNPTNNDINRQRTTRWTNEQWWHREHTQKHTVGVKNQHVAEKQADAEKRTVDFCGLQMKIGWAHTQQNKQQHAQRIASIQNASMRFFLAVRIATQQSIKKRSV